MDEKAGRSAGTRLCLSSFLPIILSSASGFASMLLGAEVSGAAPTVHRAKAAAELRFHDHEYASGHEKLCRAYNEFKSYGSSKHAGMEIFSGFSPKAHSVLLDISDGFLLAFAKQAAKGYAHNLPEHVAIPRAGIAADSEASAYARSRLYAVSRTAPCPHLAASRNALFRCLCLFSLEGRELCAAHSSAVRASLEACEERLLGSVDSAAMAAALIYAENPQTNLR